MCNSKWIYGPRRLAFGGFEFQVGRLVIYWSKFYRKIWWCNNEDEDEDKSRVFYEWWRKSR